MKDIFIIRNLFKMISIGFREANPHKIIILYNYY